MCKSQFLKYFSEESCKSCSSIQKADKCVEFDECSSYSFEYFKAGFESVKIQYEEKIRWIPIEEKLPENDIRVLTKFKNGKVIVNSYDIHMDKWQYEFDVEYTHWRSIL